MIRYEILLMLLSFVACSDRGSGSGLIEDPYATVGHNADLDVSITLDMVAGVIRCTLDVSVEPDQQVSSVVTLTLQGVGETEYGPIIMTVVGEGEHVMFYENFGPILGAKGHVLSTAEDQTQQEDWAFL